MNLNSIVQTCFLVTLSTGRYTPSFLPGLLRRLHCAGKRSKLPTRTERRAQNLDRSIRRDLSGVRRRRHGWDVRSLAEHLLARLRPVIRSEQQTQALEYYRELAAIFKDGLDRVEAEIARLDLEAGTITLAFEKDQRLLAEAKMRAWGSR